jgi:hypothetical protein
MSADQTSNPSQDLADGLATLTDEERAALTEDVDDLKRDDSAIEDGDDDDGEADDAPADEAEPDDLPADKPAKPAVQDEAADEAAEPGADPAAAQADDTPDPDARKVRVPAFEAQLPADFEERKTALQTREDEAEQKYEDGEIDRATLRATLREVAAERETLVRIQTKVELAQEMAQQEEGRELRSAVNKVMEQGKADGIDYNKDEHWDELKAFVTVVEARNPTKSVDWVMREAHRRVLLANDIEPAAGSKTNAPAPKPAAKADAKAEALARRKPDASKAQPTLAQVPGGDGPGDVGSEFADIDALDGDKYEAALERLRKSNPAAYEKYMAEI